MFFALFVVEILMPDLIVKLFDLPPLGPPPDGVTVRAAMPYEAGVVCHWIAARFGARWADEARVGFARQPVSTLLAVREQKLIGFACYDCTARGYFGPTGVDKAARGAGIGTHLLFAALHGLKNLGYGYAIIGAAGPVEWYAKTCGAAVIPDAGRGIYPPTLQGD